MHVRSIYLGKRRKTELTFCDNIQTIIWSITLEDSKKLFGNSDPFCRLRRIRTMAHPSKMESFQSQAVRKYEQICLLAGPEVTTEQIA
jgi:hypothetical protein